MFVCACAVRGAGERKGAASLMMMTATAQTTRFMQKAPLLLSLSLAHTHTHTTHTMAPCMTYVVALFWRPRPMTTPASIAANVATPALAVTARCSADGSASAPRTLS